VIEEPRLKLAGRSRDSYESHRGISALRRRDVNVLFCVCIEPNERFGIVE
jgi:hypothetical protein